MYQSYADKEYYLGVFQGNIPEKEIEQRLKQASRHIDTLTYNRIVGKGVSSFTEFQQDILKEVCCEQAEFEYQNREIFDSVLQEYSIDGLRMKFGENWNVSIQKGIPMKRDVYELLSQTGLTCRLAV